MANQPISMSKLRQIIKLHSQGMGKKKIALRLGASKHTVKHYIDFYCSLKKTHEEILKLSDLDLNNLFHPTQVKPPGDKLRTLYECFPAVEKQLRRKGMTLIEQWRRYRKSHPDGYSETQFGHYFNLWRKKITVSMPIHHKEGDKTYIDFTGHKLPYVDEDTGEIKQAEVFVAILGWSQYSYVEALLAQTEEELITGTENAFHFFGGVTQAAVPDNLKSAVIKACRYEPDLNKNFAAFADYYGFTIFPARARKPQDKAHVENMVKIVYQQVYAHLDENEILPLKQLNDRIRERLQVLNDSILTGKDCSRSDQLKLELPSLQPLPEKRYELRKIKQVTVMKNGHVYLGEDKHYYSVPYELIGKKLTMHYSRSTVLLYLDYNIIASHKRTRSPHNYTTEPNHVPPQHRAVTEWCEEYFIAKAKEIDPVVELYIKEVLAKKAYPAQAYRSCNGILMLGRKASAKRLISACNRAHAAGYYGYKAIDKILKQNADLFDDDPEPSTMPTHENIRGADYYQ